MTLLFPRARPRLGLLLAWGLSWGALACGDNQGASGREGAVDGGGAEDADAAPGAGATCEDLSRQAASAVYDATARAFKACKQASDCSVVQIKLSCLEDCSSVTVNAPGKAKLEQELAMFEAASCTPYANPARGCALPEPGDCAERDEVVRCFEGRCGTTTPACDDGCSVQSDGLCRGASECEGCPAVATDWIGLPCTEAQRTCTTPAFCPIHIQCVEDTKSAGSLRWERMHDGCE